MVGQEFLKLGERKLGELKLGETTTKAIHENTQCLRSAYEGELHPKNVINKKSPLPLTGNLREKGRSIDENGMTLQVMVLRYKGG
ncbi:hypothetical protein Ancab_037579 [Ancistrocladus abbreviatus]